MARNFSGALRRLQIRKLLIHSVVKTLEDYLHLSFIDLTSSEQLLERLVKRDTKRALAIEVGHVEISLSVHFINYNLICFYTRSVVLKYFKVAMQPEDHTLTCNHHVCSSLVHSTRGS